MTERQIEGKFRDEVRKMGGKALKFVSPGQRGVPDRIVFLPNGQAVLAEMKAPGGKLSPLQLRKKTEFEKLGFRYYVIDSYEKIENFIALEF